jgi:uncharacterized protein YjcR
MTNEPEKWSSLEEIAEHLGVSKDTIRAWIKKKLSRIAASVNSISLKYRKWTRGSKAERVRK